MRGFWSETNWRLDGADLLLPNGQRIPLKHVLQWREDQIAGNADLTGKWSGWRIRQQWLIPPGGTIRHHRIAEHVMRHHVSASEWDRKEHSRRQMTLF